MYPVSADYKNAIKKEVRDVRITGTITLKDDTVITITDEDVVQGSLYITEQCVSGEDIEVGNVYAAEMGLSLSTPLDNPYSLDGARILLHFGLKLDVNLWETVPLGYYYVTDIARKAGNVDITALDGMMLFDVPVGDPGLSSPKDLVAHACSIAGVTLANVAEVATFANATSSFELSDRSKVKTCRDLLMWACQIMGCFARMNRQGQLEIVAIATRQPVKSIDKKERFSSDVSDFAVKITRVSMQVGETEYYRGTDGMTMILEENPLMIGLSDEQINSMLNSLLAQLTQVVYVPFRADYMGDPALQPGDYITIRDAGILDSEIETYFLADSMPFDIHTDIIVSMITHSTWRYRGKHNIKAAGKIGLVRGVQNQQAKAVSSIATIALAADWLARSANQSTQLIKDAIGGHVLIRQNPDETNEILIMDHPDPEQATKIWRWNMGGLGYSYNCVGADNPAREYEIAMTMDGAINANFIRTGVIDAQFIRVGEATKFQGGYNPAEVAAELNTFIATTYADDIASIQDQLDGKIATWFYSGVPTLSSAPASDWTTDELKYQHIGDLYYDTDTGYAYRFMLDGTTTYKWQEISDTAVMQALALASQAQDTADGKRRVFVATPYPPYDVGDLWTGGSSGDLKRCKKAKASGGYDPDDWELATKYTDDAAANAYAEQKAAEAQAAAEAVATAEATLAQTSAEAYADGIVTAEERARIDQAESNLAEAKQYAEVKASEAQAAAEAAANTSLNTFVESTYTPNMLDMQTQIDGKIDTWYQPAEPGPWAGQERIDHNGDMWYQTGTSILRRYNGNFNIWEIIESQTAADAYAKASRADDTADGKRRVFTAQPYPPYDVGDLWTQGPAGDIYKCKTAKASTPAVFIQEGLIIPGIAAIFDLADWELASKYTDDSALETFAEAVTGGLEEIQTQIDSKIETWFQDTDPNTWPEGDRAKHNGDMWYSSATKLLKRYNSSDDTWTTIENKKAVDAYDKASTAQDTADGKRRVFVATPYPPYDVGDLWTGGSSGELMRCKMARTEGQLYSASDWELATKYTDDTLAKTKFDKPGFMLATDNGVNIHDGQGASRAFWGQYEPGIFGGKVMHDGSYTTLSYDGLLRHIAGTQKNYLFMVHGGDGKTDYGNEVYLMLKRWATWDGPHFDGYSYVYWPYVNYANSWCPYFKQSDPNYYRDWDFRFGAGDGFLDSGMNYIQESDVVEWISDTWIYLPDEWKNMDYNVVLSVKEYELPAFFNVSRDDGLVTEMTTSGSPKFVLKVMEKQTGSNPCFRVRAYYQIKNRWKTEHKISNYFNNGQTNFIETEQVFYARGIIFSYIVIA